MAQQPVQMNVGLGGPAWANPTGAPMQQQQTMPTNVSSTIGGSIANQHENEFFAPVSTLDEPIRETIMRDVRSVGSKLKVVLLPMERSVCFFLPSRRQINCHAVDCQSSVHQCLLHEYHLAKSLWNSHCFRSFIPWFNSCSYSASVRRLFGSLSVRNDWPHRSRQTNYWKSSRLGSVGTLGGLFDFGHSIVHQGTGGTG